MWHQLVAAAFLAVCPATAPPDVPAAMLAGPIGPAPLAPYVSCRDGYVAPTLDQCPTIQKHTTGPPIPPIGGGPRRRGGLLGLGGIGGLL